LKSTLPDHTRFDEGRKSRVACKPRFPTGSLAGVQAVHKTALKMTTRTKSLTIALALVLTVAPAFALASCSQDIAGMHSEMVGMVMPPAGLSFSEMPSFTCCVFAPA